MIGMRRGQLQEAACQHVGGVFLPVRGQLPGGARAITLLPGKLLQEPLDLLSQLQQLLVLGRDHPGRCGRLEGLELQLEVERVLIPVDRLEGHARAVIPPLKAARGDQAIVRAVVRRLGQCVEMGLRQPARDAGQGVAALGIRAGPTEGCQSVALSDLGEQPQANAPGRLPVRAHDLAADRDCGPGREQQHPAPLARVRLEVHDLGQDGRSGSVGNDGSTVVRPGIVGRGGPDLERTFQGRDVEAPIPVGPTRQGDREPAEPAAIRALQGDHLARQGTAGRQDDRRRPSLRGTWPLDDLAPVFPQPPDELDAGYEPDIAQLAASGRDIDPPRRQGRGIDDQLGGPAVGDVEPEPAGGIGGPRPAQAADRLLGIG